MRAIRNDMSAFDLGDADWLVFRHNLNPYGEGSYKAKRYDVGYKSSKKKTPDPPWRPV